MRHGRVLVEHRRGIGADTEERRAGEIEHAGVAELDVQPERRDGVEQYRADQQQNEMVLVEHCGDRECGDDGERAERIFARAEAARYRRRAAEPIRGDHGDDAERQQRDDRLLVLHAQQDDQKCRR